MTNLKKEAEKLMKIKGEARGVHFKNDAEYVLLKEGKQGLDKVEKELEGAGFPIDYKKIKNTEFYPVGLRGISLLAIKQALGWGDKEIKDLCGFSVVVSLIARIYMKFFYSIPKMIKVAPKIWEEYFTVGSFKVTDYNEKEKSVVLRVKDFDLHPTYCCCIEGFLKNIIKMITGAKEVSCRETKCSFKGGKYHEFLAQWK